jgi:metal-responsive CopG/Arc/MetJ family transcriptional regulator
MARGSTRRFTISLQDSLMATLDRLRSAKGYGGNRSEFVRDLVRAELVKEEWAQRTKDTVGILILVYDHDTRLLADRLTDIQHRSYRDIAAETPCMLGHTSRENREGSWLPMTDGAIGRVGKSKDTRR